MNDLSVKPSQVKASDLRRIAELANLDIGENEEVSMLRDMNSILDHVAQLNELDTSDVPAMAQVGEIMSGVSGASGSLRRDEPRPSLDRAQVMVGAPDSDDTYFRVPKVIER